MILKRVVAPTVDDKGLDAVLSEHFGRAPYFALVDVEETGKGSNIEFIPNTSEHFGGSGLPPDRIIGLKPSALITYGMGPRAIERFQEAGVAVLKADSSKLGEVIEAYRNDQLEELTEGCGHARH
jgi:predicted Fe-Mo cluster-binding NifX family protein